MAPRSASFLNANEYLLPIYKSIIGRNKNMSLTG